MEEENIVGRYWCHVCSQEVNPITEVVEIKCPRCNNGFIEQVEEDDLLQLGGGGGGGGISASPETSAAAAAAEREQPSMWAPILLGMLAGGNRNTESRASGGPSAIIHLVRSLQESNSSESRREGEREREREHLILINPFSQAVIIHRPSATTRREDDGSNDNSNNFAASSASFGDYFLGPGLEQLLQLLAENDPNRHGTPPAQKSAVEAMLTVPVEENTTCTVCLEEMEIGESAREMPCKHRFHGGCILPWLEMHSSCPVCRFQMPVDEETKDTTGRSSGEEEGGGRTEGNGNERRFSLPLLWSFSGLFSSSSVDSSESSGGNSNSQSQEN